MKGFRMKGTAMVLLCISIAVSGLGTVRAEGMAAGNIQGTEYLRGNNTVSGGDAVDSGSNAIGTDGDWDTDGCITGTGVEDKDSSAGTDARDKDGNTVGTDVKDTEGSTAAEIAGDTETEKADVGGNQKDGGTVSGGDAAGTESSGDREEDEGVDTGDKTGADNAGSGDDGGNAGEGGEDEQEIISPYDLTVYPDDRLMQWNMGNSSGKYGSSYDSYAVFDDNVIAALYGLGNDTYRLELTGTGEMAGPGGYDYQPYRAYRNKIISVAVGDGITNVGQKVFSRFSNLQEYTLPSSVKTIGEYCCCPFMLPYNYSGCLSQN